MPKRTTSAKKHENIPKKYFLLSNSKYYQEQMHSGDIKMIRTVIKKRFFHLKVFLCTKKMAECFIINPLQSMSELPEISLHSDWHV